MKILMRFMAGSLVALIWLMAQPSLAAAPPKKPSLEQRVQAIEDREAILKVMRQYAYTLDFGQKLSDYTALYTDDAVFQSIVPGQDEAGRAGAVVGRLALEQWIANEWRNRDRLLAAGHYRIHAMTEPDITLDGDSATARSYFETTDNDNGRIYLVSIGVYQDMFVRSPDGRWLIKQRLLLRQGAVGNAGGAAGAGRAGSPVGR